MPQMPGLAVAMRFLRRIARMVQKFHLDTNDVEARMDLINAVMWKGYKPDPKRLEAVRRACGWYPEIEVIKTFEVAVNPMAQCLDPRTDCGLEIDPGTPPYTEVVSLVRITHGQKKNFESYRGELVEQKWALAGEAAMDAYARMVQDQEMDPWPTGQLFYNDIGDWMVDTSRHGIISDSARNFSCEGDLFLVVREEALVARV